MINQEYFELDNIFEDQKICVEGSFQKKEYKPNIIVKPSFTKTIVEYFDKYLEKFFLLGGITHVEDGYNNYYLKQGTNTYLHPSDVVIECFCSTNTNYQCSMNIALYSYQGPIEEVKKELMEEINNKIRDMVNEREKVALEKMVFD